MSQLVFDGFAFQTNSEWRASTSKFSQPALSCAFASILGRFRGETQRIGHFYAKEIKKS